MLRLLYCTCFNFKKNGEGYIGGYSVFWTVNDQHSIYRLKRTNRKMSNLPFFDDRQEGFVMFLAVRTYVIYQGEN